MKPNLTQTEVNHLRKLLGWVRCEVGQTPDEYVNTARAVGTKLAAAGHVPDERAKAELVEGHQRAAAVPKYVRAAAKALEKLLVKQDGHVVDVQPQHHGAERCLLPARPGAVPAALPAPATTQARSHQHAGTSRFYVGVRPCGCATAWLRDDEQTTPAEVADFARRMAKTSRRVEHRTLSEEEFNAQFSMDCECKPALQQRGDNEAA